MHRDSCHPQLPGPRDRPRPLVPGHHFVCMLFLSGLRSLDKSSGTEPSLAPSTWKRCLGTGSPRELEKGLLVTPVALWPSHLQCACHLCQCQGHSMYCWGPKVGSTFSMPWLIELPVSQQSERCSICSGQVGKERNLVLEEYCVITYFVTFFFYFCSEPSCL